MNMTELFDKAISDQLPPTGSMILSLGCEIDLLSNAVAAALVKQRSETVPEHMESMIVLMRWGVLIGYYYAMKQVGDEMLSAKDPT